MSNLERVAIAVGLILMAAVFIGQYSTWRDCEAVGGVTVRGVFGMECIKQ